MQETTTRLTNRPAWVDLATPDAAASREFYSSLFGWQMDVSDDPQYGGYATASIGGKSAAGIGPKQSEQQPTVWSLYIGSDDLEALARKVTEAGGNIITPPFDVGDQGRMAVFQDPTGGFINAWQTSGMSGFGVTDVPNAFGWAELNARGVENAVPFYEKVFGWTTKTTPASAEAPAYNEFQLDGESVLGAYEMNPAIPAGVPSYWLVYFIADDIDATFRKAIDAGAQQVLPPQEYPGGRFAILTDPQGASFGLLETSAR
jgi:predicted enzyme related to lactoylglutathione lyase